MSVTLTPIFAGLLALLLLALTARVIYYRISNKLSLGDGGDPQLLQRMRAHGNCAEYAPLGLVLLLILELSGAGHTTVLVLGVMLLAGRLSHAYGLSVTPLKMSFRRIGMVLTLTMILLTSLLLIAHSVT